MSSQDHVLHRPSWLPADERVAARSSVHLPVFLLSPGGEPYSATVIDVSTHGFRVQCGYLATVGQFLALDIPAFARYSGWVAWAKVSEFGLDVAHPLPEMVVNHIMNLAAED
jgi:hypothetical protein